MRIYLVGFMGSGKSTLGQLAARQFEVPFLDTDAAIEATEKMSIADIFARHGEYAFRQAENQMLKSSLAIGKGIIATGGGMPCHDGNMDWIVRHGISIYLQWPTDLLVENLLRDRTKRPLLDMPEAADPKARIMDILNSRVAYYEQAAITIEMSGDMAKDQAAWIKTCKYIW